MSSYITEDSTGSLSSLSGVVATGRRGWSVTPQPLRYPAVHILRVYLQVRTVHYRPPLYATRFRHVRASKDELLTDPPAMGQSYRSRCEYTSARMTRTKPLNPTDPGELSGSIVAAADGRGSHACVLPCPGTAVELRGWSGHQTKTIETFLAA